MYLAVNESTSPVLAGKAAQAVVIIEQALCCARLLNAIQLQEEANHEQDLPF